MLRDTARGERVNSITSIAVFFKPSPRCYTPQLSPIFFCATHRNASGHGKGRRLNTNDFLSLSKKAPPQLSGFLACRYGRRRGAAELAPLKQSSPFSLRLPCDFTAR